MQTHTELVFSTQQVQIHFVLKELYGHSARDITADVYTHKTLEELIATIDLI